jgi:hypothetical protein
MHERDVSYIFPLLRNPNSLINAEKRYLLVRRECDLEETADPTCEALDVTGILPRAVDDTLYERKDFCPDIRHNFYVEDMTDTY